MPHSLFSSFLFSAFYRNTHQPETDADFIIQNAKKLPENNNDNYLLVCEYRLIEAVDEICNFVLVAGAEIRTKCKPTLACNFDCDGDYRWKRLLITYLFLTGFFFSCGNKCFPMHCDRRSLGKILINKNLHAAQ